MRCDARSDARIEGRAASRKCAENGCHFAKTQLGYASGARTSNPAATEFNFHLHFGYARIDLHASMTSGATLVLFGLQPIALLPFDFVTDEKPLEPEFV